MSRRKLGNPRRDDASVVLYILTALRGHYVSRDVLFDGLYPSEKRRPDRPADVVHRAVCGLRKQGHRVLTKRLYGYALPAEDGTVHEPLDLTERTLQALMAAPPGAFVCARELRAILWPDDSAPASALGMVGHIVGRLRERGHIISTQNHAGYRLENFRP